jgi:tetratricopeptide (TPR) repeat protein
MLVRTAARLLVFIFCGNVLFSCHQSDKTGAMENNGNSGSVAGNAVKPSADGPEVYEKMLQADSLNTDVRLRLAAYFYSLKDLEKAMFHNLIVNRIDSNNMAAVFNLGNIYYDLQQNEQAIRYYERFLKFDHGNCNVRCDLATCYMRLNDNETAVSLLQENIRINRSHPQSHYNLSVFLKEKGKLKEAEKEMAIYNSLVSR